MAIFEVLNLPALPIIVLLYCFLLIYIFHMIAFDLYIKVKQNHIAISFYTVGCRR